MDLSNRTVALLAQPFEGGGGPSHATVELIWTSADAFDYLPTEGNKLDRVLGGLRALRSGRRAGLGITALRPDAEKLRCVAGDLSARLMAAGLLDPDELEAALLRDGFALDDKGLTTARPRDEPADRLATHVLDLFGERSELNVARNHYEQASRAFDRSDWEAANAQFRSACDAVYRRARKQARLSAS